MKYFLSLIFLFTGFSVLSAQEKHFIFIQADNNQPFYVSLNSKLYSSTSIGYLIIPKLADGDYSFSVGFPKNVFPEQNFVATINKKDLGFTLKNFAEKGWGLFNLQSLSVTMAAGTTSNNVERAISENEGAKNSNEPITFNKKKKDTLATQPAVKISTDTALTILESKNEKPVQSQVKADNDSAISTVVNASAQNKKSTEKDQKQGEIKKISETKESDGVYLSYLENKNADTVKIIIPSDINTKEENNISSIEKTLVKTDKTENEENTLPTNKKEKKEDLKFLNMNTSDKDSAKLNRSLTENEITGKKESCKNIATDEDYLRLRKKMAHETTDEKMIGEAKKAYRNRCFTTSQIKALSTLFLSDEGRYRFFDASYIAAADTSQYSTLQSEFIDKYYINRFKAMLQ